MTYIIYTNSEAHKGYTSTALQAADELKKRGKEVVINDISTQDFIAPQEGDKIVTAGSIAYDIASKNDLKEKNVSLVVLTDRVSFPTNSFPKDTTVIAPKEVVNKLPKEIKTVVADLAPSPSKQKMQESAMAFEKDNPEAVSVLENANISNVAFVGGRVQIENGWKPNTEEIFSKTAKSIVNSAKGGNVLTVFHGLRSFTNVDETGKVFGDSKPAEAFYKEAQKNLQPNQKMYCITKNFEEDGTRTSSLMIVDKQGMSKQPISENGGPTGYYYSLLKATEKKQDVSFTAEQMNFPAEYIQSGGNFLKAKELTPFQGWSLVVPSNVQTHTSVKESLKNGEEIKSLLSGFCSVIDSEKKINIALLKKNAEKSI